MALWSRGFTSMQDHLQGTQQTSLPSQTSFCFSIVDYLECIQFAIIVIAYTSLTLKYWACLYQDKFLEVEITE